MTHTLWCTFFFLLLIYPSSCNVTCNPHDNCSCYYDVSDVEIQCPIYDSDLVIHVKDSNTRLSIDCVFRLKKIHAYQLPNITIEDVQTFKMSFCPWPQEPFHKLIERFSPKNVTSLEFETSYKNISVLTAAYFQHLTYLRRLNLNENGITNVDEDVFNNTPNLIELELQDNNIILKKNLFRPVTLLEFLDLSGNKLENLPRGVFEPLKNLQKLHLWNNKLKSLDWWTFIGLVKLQSLEMSINKIESISEHAFKKLQSLMRVNLSSNKIKKFSSNLFRYNRKLRLLKMKNNFQLELPDYLLANSTITHLDLINCYLENIPEHFFQNSIHLKIIRLERNKLKHISRDLFKGLANIKQIRLQNNQIERISNVFEGLRGLRLLHLHNNLITALDPEIFSDLIGLEKLSVKGNKIEHIDSNIFNSTTKLKYINLSHNQIVTPLHEIISAAKTPNLIELDVRHNNISSVKLNYLKHLEKITIRLNNNLINNVDFENIDLNTTLLDSRIYLSNNPIDCCYNYDLVTFIKTSRKRPSNNLQIFGENLKCFSPPKLKEDSLFNVPSNLTCSLEEVSKNYHCPDECSCSWTPSSKAVIIDCSNRQLRKFPNIDLGQSDSFPLHQIEVNLEGNNLINIPVLTTYQNVTKLNLSGNTIRSVQWLPPKIEVLNLDHNHISNLDPGIVSQLNSTSLTELTLHDNPWTCDCGSATLADFLRQSNSPIVNHNIICVNKNQRLVDLKQSELCDSSKTTFLLLMVLSTLLAFTACVACYYRFQQQIKIWLFSKNLCLWWVTEEDLDKDKTYDAFISYSHKDEDFVFKNLLPSLEASPQAYRFCLHYRNWIPGELITTQITNSVLQSKRTLVVLSKNFLESVWGKMEFRTAHTQAMSEGRARVIIVLYGDLDVNSLDEELKMYLKTNTYVQWGDPYFWNKLRYALPHRKVFSSGRGLRLPNMVRVAEEATLIQSVTPSPGTTPPISLNPSMVEMNPFKFVHKLDGINFSVPV